MTDQKATLAPKPTPTRPYGMHPLAFAAFLTKGISVSRIGQTIGTAKASAGTHEKDGEYEGHDYAACADLHIADLSHTEAHAIADKLAVAGFCPFVRIPGQDHWPEGDAYHLHFVFPACTMKEMVQHQVRDFCHTPNLNGLASHAAYAFWHPTAQQQKKAKAALLAHNP